MQAEWELKHGGVASGKWRVLARQQEKAIFLKERRLTKERKRKWCIVVSACFVLKK
jgi:hypothetical protein